MDANPYQPSSTVTITPVTARGRSLWYLFTVSVAVPLIAEFAVLLGTGTTDRLLWLFQQAAPLPIVVWPISLPIAVWIFFSYTIALQADTLDSRRLLWLVPLIVLPTAMLVWGAVFECPSGRRLISWQLTVVHWTFFLTVVIGVFAIAFNGGRRSFVTSVTLMLLLISFSCAFTAGSSVTGEWL